MAHHAEAKVTHLRLSNAVSQPVFWITLIVGTVASIAGSPGLAAEDPVTRFIAVLAGQLTLFASLIVADRLAGRRGRPTWQSWITVGSFVLASAMSAAAQGVASVGLGLSPNVGLQDRVPIWVVLMTTTLVIATQTTGATRAHHQMLRTLVVENNALIELRTTMIREADARNALIIESISEELHQALNAAAANPQDSAGKLRYVGNEIIRPVSHALGSTLPDLAVATESQGDVRFDWRQWLIDVTTPPLIRTIQLSSVMGALSLFYGLAAFTPIQALQLAILNFAVLVLLSFSINAIYVLAVRALNQIWRAILAIALLTALTLTQAVALELLSSDWQYGETFYLAALITPVMALLLTSARAAALQRERSEIAMVALTDNLRWEVAHTREGLREQQQSLSRKLHGPVQSAVMAAALKLTEAARCGEVSIALLDESRSLISDALLSATTTTAPLEFDTALARLIGMWRGVCEIEIDISDEARHSLKADSGCSAAVVDIIIEACGNAVRHAHATQITAQIALTSPRLIRLIVADNGNSRSQFGPAGMGSEILHALTLEVSTDRRDTGTTVTAMLAVSPQPASPEEP